MNSKEIKHKFQTQQLIFVYLVFRLLNNRKPNFDNFNEKLSKTNEFHID